MTRAQGITVPHGTWWPKALLKEAYQTPRIVCEGSTWLWQHERSCWPEIPTSQPQTETAAMWATREPLQTLQAGTSLQHKVCKIASKMTNTVAVKGPPTRHSMPWVVVPGTEQPWAPSSHPFWPANKGTQKVFVDLANITTDFDMLVRLRFLLLLFGVCFLRRPENKRTSHRRSCFELRVHQQILTTEKTATGSNPSPLFKKRLPQDPYRAIDIHISTKAKTTRATPSPAKSLLQHHVPFACSGCWTAPLLQQEPCPSQLSKMLSAKRNTHNSKLKHWALNITPSH